MKQSGIAATLFGLSSLLAGCSSGGLSPGSGSQGGLPEGTYTCSTYSWVTDAWGSLYPRITYVDDLTVLPGGRYRTTLNNSEGSYTYNPTTRKISYTGIYAEHYSGATYTPAAEEPDGDERIENVLIGDDESTVNCYM